MKTLGYASLIALWTTNVAAQLNGLPQCATQCLVTGFSSDGCLGLTDFVCHCNNIDTAWASVSPCLERSCSSADTATTNAGMVQVCKDAGIDISLPNGTSVSSAVQLSGSAVGAPSSLASSRFSSAFASATGTRSASATSAVAKLSSMTMAGARSTTTGSRSTETPSPSDSTSTAPSEAGHGSKAPIGAIVGGVIGGLAILCIAGVTVFYIKRRHPRAKETPHEAVPPPRYRPGNEPIVKPELHSESLPPYHPGELPGGHGGQHMVHEAPTSRG